MRLHVTEEPRHDGIQTLLSPNKSLARQVLQVQRSVADITSRMELILAQMGLQEKAKGGESGAGHEARERVSPEASHSSATIRFLHIKCPFSIQNGLLPSRPAAGKESASDALVLLDRGTRKPAVLLPRK